MTIKNQYQLVGESAIASYNYTDIANGTGVAHFYLFAATDNTSTTYNITDNSSIYSSHVEIADGIGGTGTYDFDLTAFNSPRYVKGTAIARFSTYTISDLAPTITLTLQKVSNGVTTSISSGIAISVGGAGNVYTLSTLKIPLTSTNFKKGDILRLHIAVGTWSGGGDILYLGIDPKARVGTAMTNTAYPTSFDLFVPFRIDL